MFYDAFYLGISKHSIDDVEISSHIEYLTPADNTLTII